MIIQFQVAKLFLKAPLHLSSGKPHYESSGRMLHSDTLKSALYAAAGQIHGFDQLAASFMDELCISSAYPFFRDEYFFPKPMARLPFTVAGIQEEAKLSKKLKKLQYLGLSFFERALAGIPTVIQTQHLLEHGKWISEGISSRPNESLRLLKSDLQQRVRVPREGETVTGVDENGHPVQLPRKPDTFYVEKLHFHPEGGLFFLCYNLSKDQQAKITRVLKWLGENGLGTNKQLGFGRFEFHGFEPLELHIPKPTGKWLNLGLYCPAGSRAQDAEISADMLKKSAYNLIHRGGWLASPESYEHLTYRKKSIYMFQEACVFDWGEMEEFPLIRGKRVNLSPDEGPEHPVWRDGKSFFVPIVADVRQ